jgi:hypothetical protein
MSPKSNYLQYLNYFHESVKDCTPARADDPEWRTQKTLDDHWIRPEDLQPLTKHERMIRLESGGYIRYCPHCKQYKDPDKDFYTGKQYTSVSNPRGYYKLCRKCHNKSEYQATLKRKQR